MSIREAEKVLKELHEVRPEKLNDKTKRLFDAIMLIADERDIYKKRNKNAIKYVNKNCYLAFDKEINGIGLASQRLDTCADLVDILEGKKDE